MSSKTNIELSSLAAGLENIYANENGPGCFPLLSLPKGGQDCVLEFLSLWSLMDLRLVCKEINKWVEERFLLKFALHIKSHSQMEEEEFQKSITPWSNVVIRCDALNMDINWIQNPLYSQLLDKLANSLSTLKLNDHRLPYFGLRSILFTCKSLKRLEIGTLSCAGWEEEDERSEEWQKMAKSCENLETLCISFLAWNNDDELDLFKTVLGPCCLKLTYLKVPHILMAALFQHGVDEEEIDRRYLALIISKIVKPVLQYLRRVEQAISPAENNSKVNKKVRGYLDVDNIHQTEIFPRIAQACFVTRTRLLNVSEAYEDHIPPEEALYLQAVESLSGFTKYLYFSDCSNLKSISLNTETSADSEINEKSIIAPIPTLNSISFCLPDDISRNILTCFVKQRRENVTSVTIEFQVDDPVLTHLFKISDFVYNYKQLQHLTFLEWSGKDDDLIVVLTSLTSLQSLKLQACPKITDRGFLGMNPTEPVLLNLTKLKDLWIDCQISNAVLKYAVRHMHLESFFYSSDRITLPGFLSLTQGPLTTSLINLPVLKPEDCTTEILVRFLSFFQNLKRSPSSVRFDITA